MCGYQGLEGSVALRIGILELAYIEQVDEELAGLLLPFCSHSNRANPATNTDPRYQRISCEGDYESIYIFWGLSSPSPSSSFLVRISTLPPWPRLKWRGECTVEEGSTTGREDGSWRLQCTKLKKLHSLGKFPLRHHSETGKYIVEKAKLGPYTHVHTQAQAHTHNRQGLQRSEMGFFSLCFLGSWIFLPVELATSFHSILRLSMNGMVQKSS